MFKIVFLLLNVDIYLVVGLEVGDDLKQDIDVDEEEDISKENRVVVVL